MTRRDFGTDVLAHAKALNRLAATTATLDTQPAVELANQQNALRWARRANEAADCLLAEAGSHWYNAKHYADAEVRDAALLTAAGNLAAAGWRKGAEDHLRWGRTELADAEAQLMDAIVHAADAGDLVPQRLLDSMAANAATAVNIDRAMDEVQERLLRTAGCTHTRAAMDVILNGLPAR